MRAVICNAYGPPEVLTIQEVVKPVPKNKEVLVKVMATAVNSGDSRIRGLMVGGFMRIIMRIVLGFRGPRNPILGLVLSGVIEDVGKDVTKFKIGDEVFASTGFKMGANAQYIALSDKSTVLLKPQNASFEEAAAIIFGGNSAIHFLNKAGIASKSNQDVLIFGATGSVGSAAVEIAKHFHAKVTSICSEAGVELCTKLGSDEIIVYTQSDFTKMDRKFDIIFDAVGKIKKKDCLHLLKPGGKYVSVDSMDVAKETTDQMELLRDLFEQDKLHANIDKIYPLEEIVEAHRYVDTGRKKSNVIIKISH